MRDVGNAAEQLEPEVQPVTVAMQFSRQQMAIIDSRVPVQWIGTATKTGKTTAFAATAARVITEGGKVGWCGPWAKRTRTGYMLTKEILKTATQYGEAHPRDSDMRIEHVSGGAFEPFNGENPESIFGDGFSLFIIDEASRQPADVLTNALTTVSATDGIVKLGFNLEHGYRNWAVAGMLRVKALSLAERGLEGEDFLQMTTAEGGYVKPEVIERMRRKMPRAMFEALYNAVIPESDVSLFHNLEELFVGPAPAGPEKGHAYIMGVDLGRKQNYTVGTVLDATANRFVATVRFNEIDWTLQYEKLNELRKKWQVTKAWVDATGLGDPVIPELEKRGFKVEPYQFTEKTRKELIEGLIIACDGKVWSAPDNEEFENHRHELQMFGYEMDDNGKVRYAAQEHEHDDCVMSLALAWYGKSHGIYAAPQIERVQPQSYRDLIKAW